MKKVMYVIPALLLLFVSCLQDSFTGTDEEEGLVNLSFTLNIPGANEMIRTRAWKETDVNENKNLLIDNLYVLLFDEAGFISRHKASQSSGVGSFTVQLPASREKRVLHFVCNYDQWDDFSDKDMQNRNEATVLANMYVNYPVVAYWNRTEVENITSGLSLSLTLIRNVAKISVVNNSESGMDEGYLEDVSFAIGNYYNCGTVTNFNTTTGSFDDNGILEARNAELCTIQDESDFVPAYTYSLQNEDGISLLAYERFNSNANSDDHLFIIIKGTYYKPNEELINEKQEQERYYKIDIVEPNSEVLFDIRRNRHYILTINQVLSEGYTTLEDAINSLALNNIATSVMQSYNSISDGDDILNLEYVNRLFVKPGDPDEGIADFTIRYSYVDGTTGATDNRNVQMIWGTKETDRASIRSVESLLNRKYPGAINNPENYLDKINGKLVASLPENGVAESFIRITKNNLSRTILLRLRQPFRFENTDLNPDTVSKRAGIPVTLSFDIPATLEDQLPFQVYIYGSMLAPDTGSKIYFEDMGSTFRYRYTVTSTGSHSLIFKTGSTHGEGEIRIESDLFETESLLLYRE